MSSLRRAKHVLLVLLVILGSRLGNTERQEEVVSEHLAVIPQLSTNVRFISWHHGDLNGVLFRTERMMN